MSTQTPPINNRFFALAHEKGWWPNVPVTDGGTRLDVSSDLFLSKLALISTEIRELEVALLWDGLREPPCDEDAKPEGWLSEIVDVYIRCNDLLGACGRDEIACPASFDRPTPMLSALRLYQAVADVAENERGSRLEALKGLTHLTFLCVDFAYGMGVDTARFQAMVGRKHAYNATRPQRHGDKRA